MKDEIFRLIVKGLDDYKLLVILYKQPSAEQKKIIWEELYDRYYNYVYARIHKTFIKLPVGMIEIDDILNDVFLEFFKKLETRNILTKIKDPDRTSGYLRSVLTNLIKDMIRKVFGRGRFPTDESALKIDVSEIEPQALPKVSMIEEPLEIVANEVVSFIRTTVNQRLRGQDEKYRQIFVARLEEEPQASFKNIAKRLCIAEATVRQRYRRALKKVRAALLKEIEEALGKGKWNDYMLKLVRQQLKDADRKKGKET